MKYLQPKPGTRLFLRRSSRGSRYYYEYDLYTRATYRVRIKDGARLYRTWWSLTSMVSGTPLFTEVSPAYLQLPEGM